MTTGQQGRFINMTDKEYEQRIADDVLTFLEDQQGELKRYLSETGDQLGAASRLEDMLRNSFPTLPYGATYRDISQKEIAMVLASLREAGHIGPVTINIIKDSPNATLIQAPAAVPTHKPKPTKQTLKFLFIQDDSLCLRSRVLFSYLSRLARLKAPASMNRLRRYTGYSHKTLRHLMSDLEAKGYIDSHRRPLKRFKGYLVARNGDDAEIVRNIVKVNEARGRIIRWQWAIKAFGISRRTFFRYMGGLCAARKREHLTPLSGTSDTKSENI